MNDTPPQWWTWIDTLIGWEVGLLTALGTLFGWNAKNMKGLENRFDEKVDAMQAQLNEHAESITRLEAHHEAKMQRLDSIDKQIRSIDEKQDKQMDILLNLSSQRKNH